MYLYFDGLSTCPCLLLVLCSANSSLWTLVMGALLIMGCGKIFRGWKAVSSACGLCAFFNQMTALTMCKPLRVVDPTYTLGCSLVFFFLFPFLVTAVHTVSALTRRWQHCWNVIPALCHANTYLSAHIEILTHNATPDDIKTLICTSYLLCTHV